MPLPTFTPSYPPTTSAQKPEIKLLEAEFGDGYTQVVPDGLNHMRQVHTLTWEFLTDDQAVAIMTFLFGQNGCDPFYWTPSGAVTPLKMTCREFQRTCGTPNKIEATFRQSFTR